MSLYPGLMEQYNAASEEEKNAGKDGLNKIVEEFGDDLFTSESDAKMAWSDLSSQAEKAKIAAFIEENLLDRESGEGESGEGESGEGE